LQRRFVHVGGKRARVTSGSSDVSARRAAEARGAQSSRLFELERCLFGARVRDDGGRFTARPFMSLPQASCAAAQRRRTSDRAPEWWRAAECRSRGGEKGGRGGFPEGSRHSAQFSVRRRKKRPTLAPRPRIVLALCKPPRLPLCAGMRSAAGVPRSTRSELAPHARTAVAERGKRRPRSAPQQ
jgi:hypothetical protein